MDTADTTRVCAVCGGQAFTRFTPRSDGIWVLRCEGCGMGVVETVPDDLMQFYGDEYFGAGAQAGSAPQHGYSDYLYTAEHGVSWAAALVKVLFPRGGRVLDIGCADGHLLAKLGPAYTRFGIEANETMCRIAGRHGVTILGRDLLDPAVTEALGGSFDVVTAIAVFEHLRDIRSGFATALSLLRDDGVLLFEVPLMSAAHDNSVWLSSSLEHVWYPSEPSLQRLVEIELGVRLVGTEFVIAGYGSTYVGLVFRAGGNAWAQGVADRVLLGRFEPTSTDEAVARMQLRLVHAAEATHADLDALPGLPVAELNPSLLRRLAQLWKADLGRALLARAEVQRIQVAWEQEVAYSASLKGELEMVIAAHVGSEAELAAIRAEVQRVKDAWETAASSARHLETELDATLLENDARRAEVECLQSALEKEIAFARRLQADLDAATSDRVRSNIQMTTEVVAAHARLAAVETELKAKIAAELHWGREKAALDQRRASAVEAERCAKHRLEVAEAAMTAALVSAVEAERCAKHRLEAALAAQSGGALRVAMILREAARRHPSAARVARRAARLVWWTVRGRLISRLRFRQQIRRQLRAEAVGRLEPARAEALPTSLPPLAPAQYTRLVLPPSAARPAPDKLVLQETTGHWSSLELAHPDPASTDWPLVSVVITSFNYGRLVTDAVDSVLNQTFKDLELIVVEGGSSNVDSRLVVAGLHGPRIRVLMQGGQHRAGANRNYGISQARGRYVCCLDADDMLAPTYIEKALYLLERHGYDVVSSAMEVVGADHGVIDIMEQPDLAALLTGNNVLTCAVYRRSLWEQAGGYRDVDRSAVGYVYEDWVFWVRLAALGARFRNLYHDPMLRYRVHGPSLSRSPDVLPMWWQRQIIRQINEDVLQDLPDVIAHSRKQAAWQYGTPCAVPAPISLEGPAPLAAHAPTVLLAMPFLILGGAERLLSAVVAHLTRNGWRVVITTSVAQAAEHGDTTHWFEQHTSEIFHLPRAFPPEMWPDFISHLVRSRAVDVIWVVGSAAVYDSLRGLRAAHPGLRVADLLFNTVGHTANNRRRRDLIDLIFVENREVLDWLGRHGEDAERIRLVESGVDLEALRPAARSADFLAQIGAAPNDIIVGFSGRWSEEKNPVGFVEIAALVDRSLSVRFVMTGTGHMRGAIERAIDAAGFPQGRFHLLGAVPELAPVLASFDLLVVPSILDGRPVVVLESLAMGVPVLASRVGALPELIESGSTGWLCEAGDSAAFAAAIELAARDRAKLRSMRQRAREYALVHLDARNMFSMYEEGLRSLLPKVDRCD
jgi:O-antigen biosynthesis protein